MICNTCEIDKPIEEFAPRDGGKRRHTKCRDCQRKYKQNYWKNNSHKYGDRYENNKEWHKTYCKKRYATCDKKHHAEVVWKNKLRREFGLSVDDYNLLLESQNGVCALCGKPDPDGKRLAVDHCHAEGHVRGLLCRTCNTALGLFEDNPDLLRKAAEYVERKRKGIEPS